MAGTFSLAFRGTFDDLLTMLIADDILFENLLDYSVLTHLQLEECKVPLLLSLLLLLLLLSLLYIHFLMIILSIVNRV